MRLLYLPPEGIMKLVEDFEKEVKGIKKNALQLAWYMRGSVTYNDVLNMSDDERKAIMEITDSNLEVTKKSGLPFF